MNRQFCIYIMTNKHNKTIYTGVTGNLIGRVDQHRTGKIGGFTRKYNLNKLVYYEVYEDPESAILREKQIKSWNRKRKDDLINALNPQWRDLYSDLVDE